MRTIKTMCRGTGTRSVLGLLCVLATAQAWAADRQDKDDADSQPSATDVGEVFVTAQRRAARSLMFSANGFASAKYFWDIGNRIVQKSYTFINAQVEWHLSGGRWVARLSGRNLTDNHHGRFRNGTTLGDAYTAADPVTYGVGLSMKI